MYIKLVIQLDKTLYFQMTVHRSDGAAFVGKLAEIFAGIRAHPLSRLQSRFPGAQQRASVQRRDERSLPA